MNPIKPSEIQQAHSEYKINNIPDFVIEAVNNFLTNLV